MHLITTMEEFSLNNAYKIQKTAKKLQDIWQGEDPSKPQISNSKLDLQGKIYKLIHAFLLMNSS